MAIGDCYHLVHSIFLVDCPVYGFRFLLEMLTGLL